MRDKTRYSAGLVGKTLLTWLTVVLILGVVTGCVSATPGATRAEPEPFECQGGGEDEDLVCKTQSLKDEFGERVEVTVSVPWQGREVDVERRPLTEDQKEELMSAPAPPFEISRLIVSFEIVDAEKEATVREFDPPFELRVEYTANHWGSAVEAGAPHPRLAFWDFEPPEGEPQWVEFTAKKHNFVVDGDEDGGLLTATIRDWGDPAHGGGP